MPLNAQHGCQQKKGEAAAARGGERRERRRLVNFIGRGNDAIPSCDRYTNLARHFLTVTAAPPRTNNPIIQAAIKRRKEREIDDRLGSCFELYFSSFFLFFK